MAPDAAGPSAGAPGAGQIPPLGRFGRALERLYATRAGAWLAINVASHVDRRLVRLSGASAWRSSGPSPCSRPPGPKAA